MLAMLATQALIKCAREPPRSLARTQSASCYFPPLFICLIVRNERAYTILPSPVAAAATVCACVCVAQKRNHLIRCARLIASPAVA